jgi:hypothetical protein
LATVRDNPRPSPWRLRLIVAACSALCVYGLALSSVFHSQWLSHWPGLLRFAVVFIVALAAMYGAAGWWAVQTWQALWRHGRDRWERIVFERGVRFFGLPVAATLLAGSTWLGWRIGAGEPHWLAAGLLTGMVVGLPIGLQLGYLGGLVLARVSGIEERPIAVLAQAPPDGSAASGPTAAAAEGRPVRMRWQQPLSRWARLAFVAGGLAGATGAAILTPPNLAVPVASLGLICVLLGWKGIPLVASVRYATGGMGARVQEGRKTIQLRGRVAIAATLVFSAFVAGLSGVLPRLLLPTFIFLAALVAVTCALRFVLSACPRCEQHFFIPGSRTGSLTQCRHCSLPLSLVHSPPDTRPKRRDA